MDPTPVHPSALTNSTEYTRIDNYSHNRYLTPIPFSHSLTHSLTHSYSRRPLGKEHHITEMGDARYYTADILVARHVLVRALPTIYLT